MSDTKAAVLKFHPPLFIEYILNGSEVVSGDNGSAFRPSRCVQMMTKIFLVESCLVRTRSFRPFVKLLTLRGIQIAMYFRAMTLDPADYELETSLV